jgi:hypothetical protein
MAQALATDKDTGSDTGGALPTGRLARVDWLWLAGIALLAIAVRVALALQPHVLQADEGAYVWLGRNLVTGRGFTFIGINEVHYTPLFPALVGALYLLIHNLEAASKICFVVLGAALVWPVYRIAMAVYGRRVARAAGLLVAVLPALTSHVLYWGSMTEPLYLFLLFMGLWYVWRAWHEGGIGRHVVAAVFLCLSYLARPEGLIFIGAAFVWLVVAGWTGWGSNRRQERRPQPVAQPAGLMDMAQPGQGNGRQQGAGSVDMANSALSRGGRQAAGGPWFWQPLAAYALVFLLFATPYVLYLHRYTGSWMLTGKVWTAYAQDRALATKDWVAFDQFTWGLDKSGEVMYHSRERFDTSLFAYMAQEPMAFVRGTIDNVRTLPGVIAGKEGMPKLLLAAVALGLLAVAWTRRCVWGELFLMGIIAVPLATFATVLYSVRFLQPVYPVLAIWAANGLLVLGDWLVGTLAEQVRKVAPWLRATLVALPVAVAVLYLGALQPGVVSHGAAYMKFNYKTAGEWLRAHTPEDAVIMSRGAIAAIHAEREWSPLPHAAWPAILAYGQKRHAGYLVITAQEIKQFQPYLAPLLLDEQNPPPELEYLHTVVDAQGRTIIYRFK